MVTVSITKDSLYSWIHKGVRYLRQALFFKSNIDSFLKNDNENDYKNVNGNGNDNGCDSCNGYGNDNENGYDYSNYFGKDDENGYNIGNDNGYGDGNDFDSVKTMVTVTISIA